ncbi:MAG TPA: hypothetical protein VGW38_03745 [Chloroflexota bacterium]|nr:hypothetical protein [Chloroflexota bacterium]
MISTGNQRPCRGTTASDEPCKNDATPGSLYCAWHDPQRVQERKQWSAKGGRASSTQKRLSRLIRDAEELQAEDVMRLLSGAMLLLMEGKLDPSHLSALASAARTLDQIRTSSDLQKRLEAIEAALDRADRRRYV